MSQDPTSLGHRSRRKTGLPTWFYIAAFIAAVWVGIALLMLPNSSGPDGQKDDEIAAIDSWSIPPDIRPMTDDETREHVHQMSILVNLPWFPSTPEEIEEKNLTAEQALRRIIEILEESYGPEHLVTADHLEKLADNLDEQDRANDATASRNRAALIRQQPAR